MNEVEIIGLLKNLQSENNDIRRNAEKELDKV